MIGPVPTTTELLTTTDYTADDFDSASSNSARHSSSFVNPTIHEFSHDIDESTIANTENTISDFGSDTSIGLNILDFETTKILLPDPVMPYQLNYLSLSSTSSPKNLCKDCMEVFGKTSEHKICDHVCSGMNFLFILWFFNAS